jgi:lipid-binding SYLF domain-containing protein
MRGQVNQGVQRFIVNVSARQTASFQWVRAHWRGLARLLVLLPVLLLVLLLALLLAFVAGPARAIDRPPKGQASTVALRAGSDQEKIASRQVLAAGEVLRRMLTQPDMRVALQEARGIFIVPLYHRAALGVGAATGQGVLLVKQREAQWGWPAFYSIGSLSAGMQAGGEGGAIVLLLNNETAVNRFTQSTAFALTAGAGLTLVDWTRRRQGAIGDGDVILWSDARGVMADLLALGVRAVRFNASLTRGYYHQDINVPDAVAGRYVNHQADPLRRMLAGAAPGPPAGVPVAPLAPPRLPR